MKLNERLNEIISSDVAIWHVPTYDVIGRSYKYFKLKAIFEETFKDWENEDADEVLDLIEKYFQKKYI
jgi:DNA-directed RNA polymerase subunit F